MIQEINSLENLKAYASRFLSDFPSSKIFLLYGEMGAGKTTFVQYLLSSMGVEELEGSPTYSLVNSYSSKEFGQIYHLDLFRLKSMEEAFDIGIEEIIDGNSFCFIEWPEKITDLFDEESIELHFSISSNKSRLIEINRISVK